MRSIAANTGDVGARRPSGEATPYRDTNRWLLLDARMRVLSIGDVGYDGAPARSVLTISAQHVLLPRLWEAQRDGRSRNEMTQFGGQFVDVVVVAVPGPASGSPVAVLGCYGPSACTFPPMPRIAGVEWSPAKSYWTGWVPEPWQPGACANTVLRPAVRWVDQVVDAQDREPTRTVAEQLLTATDDALVLHTYRTRDADGTPMTCRLAARREDSYVRGVVTAAPRDAAAVPVQRGIG